MSWKLIKIDIFLGFEHFLLSNSEAEWIVVVATPQVQVQLIGTIYVDVRIWVYWALAKRNERKPIKNARFSWFWAFLLSKNEAEWRVVVPSPQLYVQMAGTIDVAVRIWVY